MLLYEDHKEDHKASEDHKDHKGVVYAVAFSADGSTLVSAGRDGALFLRDAAGERHPIIAREPNTLSIHSVAYAMDGSLLVGGAFGWHGYRQNSAGSWQVLGHLETTPTNALAFLDEYTLAVGTGDRNHKTAGAFELWDIATGRRREPRFTEPNGVRAVAVSPARRMVAWATAHRIVRVWEILKHKPFDFPQPKDCPAVALSPDGTRLAAAVDYAVKVYNIEKRYERFELKGHKGTVSAVVFSPDGATIATGSWDHTVKLWDAATGQERATFKWPIGRVYCLAYAPDGLRLVAGGDNGSVVVWDMD
jgi:WD40 repeat protein